MILDEFLLSPLTSEQCHDLLEIIEARSIKGSVIFCTQFETEGWLARVSTGVIYKSEAYSLIIFKP